MKTPDDKPKATDFNLDAESLKRLDVTLDRLTLICRRLFSEKMERANYSEERKCSFH